ncbi:hypothetical protein LEP1GSC026_1927 [Leptospira interrogans str. 2002000623]|uniref:Uncharacterized protein n=2 Tax=Leptospira interrogans TaxID=173 RepID=N1UEA3_LEPIR|nr:hypothetical protein LEP1GSC027_2783 [Leptospira interrogans str. 2002000624]EKQ39347.1 hypothetical protein LEP1GSC025_1707 [Leptospira interrogans str. 2002000621]EKQ45902.1 hypothetical protein LEP1GSC026_1927 [Leptospira interrogans str. 2002000623]EKR44213.1 hypothetical protein LEP1GSC097_2252 [Leptospira interrogans serovar Grippotyphosa str. UI 08368]EMF73425.1 hypothetical protein LEP1GSC148_1516 [Leptospira interrogans serovar Canicola str. LT1962]EMJ69690.1 hypothetical protein L
MNLLYLNVGTPTIYKVEVYITIESVVFKYGNYTKNLGLFVK